MCSDISGPYTSLAFKTVFSGLCRAVCGLHPPELITAALQKPHFKGFDHPTLKTTAILEATLTVSAEVEAAITQSTLMAEYLS